MSYEACGHPAVEPVEASDTFGGFDLIGQMCTKCLQRLPAYWGCRNCSWSDLREQEALTVGALRDVLAELPGRTPVYAETIVGGDLGTSDVMLTEAKVATDASGYWVRLVPDFVDEFDTRNLIDVGLAFREEVSALLEENGDAFKDRPIHTLDGEWCLDGCLGCAIDEVIATLKRLVAEDDERREAAR